ncbi:MAG: MoaD/ThiS family protein [Planctomycetes bacterium]|nr:MoaD/ThiS family protein [Planctomycetota bacterium]
MLLEIRLFATFRHRRFKTKQMELPVGFLLGNLLKKLDISIKNVGILLVNGKHSDKETRLIDGDVVAIFPVVGGG